MIERKPYIDLWKSLSADKSMIFLSGPRQTGKTTLAKEIASHFTNSVYYNWDIMGSKKLLITNPAFFQELTRKDASKPIVIFDEIHKYKQWKNYVKGIYDEFKDDYIFLILGSGRLDVYQKGGDSLAGRYFHFHLFPFTLAELCGNQRKFNSFIQNPLKGFDLNNTHKTKKIWDTLFITSGFPEPFVKKSPVFYRRWSSIYLKQIIKEDIRNFADTKRIDMLELLLSLLPDKIGSPLSLNAIAQDIQTTFDSVKKWLQLLEMVYVLFRISPWTRKITRSILKEKKAYIYSYPEIVNAAARFENIVAIELRRAVYAWNESGLGKFELHYLRDKQKNEVDFLIANNHKPFLLLEVKLSDDTISKSLIYFQNILQIPAVQLVNKENIYRYIKNGSNNILVITAHRWLSSLP
ncbi:MAG: ATP-binding protein [bacterium]